MKKHIDEFITANYEKLLNITRKKIKKYKRDVCEYQMLSEAYIYTVSKEPPKEDIPKYIVHWIDVELMYPKSTTNRKRLLDSCVELWDWNVFDERQSVEDSLNFELFLNDFVKRLDRIDQIVWEVMAEKGFTKIKELSEHFDIPESTINLYRIRILKKFKEHYNEHYED